jgi:signal transduction histidine kinase
MTRRRHSISALLTVLSGCLVLLAGLVLLAVVSLSVHRSIAGQPLDVPVVGASAAAAGLSGDQAAQVKQQADAQEQQVRDTVERHTLPPMLERGAIVLCVLTAAAMWAGRVAARRIVRPVREITATARRVAGRSLHERIGLTGPQDELRELADTVDGMLSRLDAAFEGQRRFVGNASHELRTPLAINRTLVEVAMNRPDAPAQLRQLSEVLLEVNARQERLIDGLLTLARSERAVIDPVPVDLGTVVRGVMDAAHPEAARLGVTVTAAAAPVLVEGDPVLLERMVQNLVENGIRHNSSGGWVRVTVEQAAGHAVLTVTNTGPPVPQGSLPRLFEPFRRVTDRVGSGTGSGLGLSIVRSVTQVHGGTVDAVPREGGGLVVNVRLPAASPGHRPASYT